MANDVDINAHTTGYLSHPERSNELERRTKRIANTSTNPSPTSNLLGASLYYDVMRPIAQIHL